MTGSTDDSNSDDCQLQSETLSLSSIEELESNDEFGFEHPTQEQPTKGSECTIQTLYEGPQECKCCTNWVEEYPGDLRKAVEDKPETKQKALVVRMAKSHEDGKLLVMDSIVVQSPSLKKTLGEVFEGYKGITASLKKLVFKAPFHEFYYRWGRLSEILERQRRDDPVAATYTQLLYDVLGAELADLRLEIVDLLFHGVITYPHLWAIFEPGALIVKKFDDYEQFYIAQNCEYGLGVLHVNASLIDWDGTRFGYESVTHEINAFSGTQAIEDLVVLPASSHPSRSQAEAKAIARGRQFRELRGVHYKAYSGRINYTVQGRGNTRALERNGGGRIVVDAVSYTRSAKYGIAYLTALDSDAVAPTITVTDNPHRDPFGTTVDSMGYRVRDQQIMVQADMPSHVLTEEQLLICSPYVRGYSLKHKCWTKFAVTNIRDIAWNDTAFEEIILPAGYKDLATSFVEAKTTDKFLFDDIIQGKGQGVIMLLVGNPGTGKTLTAEAIADKVHRPLYVLSAGELGRYAGDVEDRLNTVFELAEKWNAVLLFDECDVFMQQRSNGQLDHNEIVSVFLRILEYYRGILFMTSNRADIIDQVFHSRIHLTLHYPDLDQDARGHIWEQFAWSQHRIDLTSEECRRLSQLPMNGRQIKNALKIATLLAVQEGPNADIEYIRTVLQAMGVAGAADVQYQAGEVFTCEIDRRIV